MNRLAADSTLVFTRKDMRLRAFRPPASAGWLETPCGRQSEEFVTKTKKSTKRRRKRLILKRA